MRGHMYGLITPMFSRSETEFNVNVKNHNHSKLSYINNASVFPHFGTIQQTISNFTEIHS